MKNVKRILSVLLVCMVAFAAMPMVSFGAFSYEQKISQDGNWWYLPDYGNDTCKLTRWCGDATTLAIPTKVDGLKVVEADLGYQGNGKNNAKKITSVSIPSTVKKLGNGCFSGLENLQYVTIPDTVNSIGDNMFHGCHSLKEFTMPKKIKTVPGEMFRDCWSLEKVTLHSAITEIGGCAFQKCGSLKSITLPSKLKTIRDSAFGESGLESVSIPNSVTFVEGYAFTLCKNLKKVKLSSNMKSIELGCFAGDAALEFINIPLNCGWIGFRAFEGCENLTTVVCKGNADIPTYNAAFTASAKLTIYGPQTKTLTKLPNFCKDKGIRFKPLNPPTFKSKTRTTTAATLKWNKVPEATGYKVYKKIGTGSYKLVKTLGATATSYKNTGLKKGTTYRYYVTTLKKDVLGNTIESRSSSVYKTYVKK